MTHRARKILIDHHTIAYSSYGTGPKLLLLHGFGISSSIWEKVIPILSSHFEVITLDFFGYGLNATLDHDVSLAAQLKLVTDFIQKIEGVDYLLGYSYGGVIASQYIANPHPSIKQVIICEAPYFEAYDIKTIQVIFNLFAMNSKTAHDARIICTSSPLKESIILIARLANIKDRALIKNATAKFLAESNMHAIMKSIIEICVPYKSLHLKKSLVPVHFLYGQMDGFARTKRAEKIRHAITGGTLVELPEVYHLMPLEKPKELVNYIKNITATSPAYQITTPPLSL